MRGFFAVVRREIAERRNVFAAAAVCSVLPFFVPGGRQEIRLYAAAISAVLFAAAISLLLGASTIGRDLSEGRLGFYFTRPIGSGAIWAGKLASIWLQTLLAAVIMLLPVGVFDFSAWWRETGSGGLVGDVGIAFAFAVLVFLAVGNVVSLAFRARSSWVAGDLVCLAAWGLAMWFAARPLLVAGAPVLTFRVALATLAACSLALLAAGGAQVAIGRVDAVRGGRARFAVLWVLLFALAGLSFPSVRWLLSPAPQDLREIGIEAAAPRGSWIAIEGWARGRADLRTSLLYDVGSGRFVRTRAGREGTIAFSGDGTAAAWTARSHLDERAPHDIWIGRFAGAQARRFRTPVTTRAPNVALSPNGSRLAVNEENAISVFEVPSGRLLASTTTDPARHYLRMVFLTEQTLRIYRMDPLPASATVDEAPGPGLASIGIVDFQIDARKLKETATIENLRRTFSIAFNDLGERLIVSERGGPVSLFDASTGRRLAALGPGGWVDAGSRGTFLSDGRPVVAESAGGNGRVHLFSKEGREERVFDLGRAGAVQFGGEPAPGRITLAIGAAGASDGFLLDLDSGAVRKLGAHLFPIATHMRWHLPQPEPGSEVTRLFSRADGSVVRLDPQTGALTTILPKR
jgi:hypothetical protein